MGKKNDTIRPASAIPASTKSTKPAAARSAIASPAPATPPAATIRPATAAPPANGDGAPATAAARKKPAKAATKEKAPAAKLVVFSTEDIALKAYFIAEHRQRHGIPGDERSDWLEAERQLRVEHKKKTPKKPATAKKRS